MRRRTKNSGSLLIIALSISVIAYAIFTHASWIGGLTTGANQWVTMGGGTFNFNVGINCSGIQGYCWNCPSNQQSSPAAMCGTSYCPNIPLFYLGNKNSLSCSSWIQTGYKISPSAGGQTATMPVANIQSAGSACTGSTGAWTIGNACASALVMLPGSAINLPLADPCAGYGDPLLFASCGGLAYFGSQNYQMNAGLLPAKLLGQDANFTSTFNEQCTSSNTDSCPSASPCPSSAATGCKTLIRTGIFGGKTVQVVDFIYTFGVDLRIGFQNQIPTFQVACSGYSLTLTPPSTGNGPCGLASAAAVSSALAWINSNDKISGTLNLNIAAPLFAFSTPYDYYGLWNVFLAAKGCIGTGASNVATCNLGGHVALPSTLALQTGGASYKDPSLWTSVDFINLPATLPKNAVIHILINGIGPTFGVTPQSGGTVTSTTSGAAANVGTDAGCQQDLNTASTSASTCQLTVQGGSLIEVPIIFQELAQLTIPQGGSISGSGNTTTISGGSGNITTTTIKISNQTIVKTVGGNIGNVTKTFQNYTSPYETIIVKVSDSSGFWSFLTCCGGFIVTLNPVNYQLTTNSSGIVIFQYVPPPLSNTQYTVFATDPGGYQLFVYTIPPNHVTPSATATIPVQGQGTYSVAIVMTTNWAGASVSLVLLLSALAVVGILGFTFNQRFGARGRSNSQKTLGMYGTMMRRSKRRL